MCLPAFEPVHYDDSVITKWIQFTVLEGDASAFHSALQRVEKASKPEDGCLHYAAFVGTEDACLFTVLEIWDSEASLEAHRQSPHLAAFKKTCGEMIKNKTALDLVPLEGLVSAS